MRTGLRVVAIAAFAIACGRNGSGNGERASAPPDGATGGGGATGPACDGYVTVRLRGVDPGALGTFDVDLAAIEATVDGAPIAPHWSAWGPLSVAGVESNRLAVLRSTPGETVDFTVRLERVHVCDATRCADVDLCTAPLAFRFDTDKVSPERCHVVLHLDLARSVEPNDGGLAFLPTYSVHY